MSSRPAPIIEQQSPDAAWEIALHAPPPHLRPYLRDLCGYTERTPAPLVRREFPGPQVVVIFDFGPPILVHAYDDRAPATRHAGGFVAGVHDRFTVTEHGGYQRGLQMNLTPIGARLFFGIPMSELSGRIVHLRDVLPAAHRSLSEELADAPTWGARFDRIERLLTSRIERAQLRATTMATMLWAMNRIEASGGAVDVGGLARELGYSAKHVITMFRDQVGVPPKLMARIVRFDRLMTRLKSGEARTWAELAADLGYADQSHLIREVRSFTGTTPTRARAMLVDLTSIAG
jgi:AraC-like DNA-binding protein